MRRFVYLYITLALFFSNAFSQPAEKMDLLVSINLEAPLVSGDPVSKLSELLRTHPDRDLRREFPMRLAQGRFAILLQDGIISKKAGVNHGSMGVRIKYLVDPRTGKPAHFMVLRILKSFLLDPTFDARLKQSALRHEWEHMQERWEYGPPKWMSHAEQATSPDVMTKELVLQRFKGELRAHLAEMKLHNKEGWQIPLEPYKGYFKGGELTLRDWIGWNLSNDPLYAPFTEYLKDLVTDGETVPFEK